MNVLFLSPEVSPWIKTGGLGDAAGALSQALAHRGHALMVVLPLHARIDRARLRASGKSVIVRLGSEVLEVMLWTSERQNGLSTVFLSHALFDRPEVYGDYPDNFFRFALFCEAALAAPEALGFRPDVVHGHDWTTGPAIWRAKERRKTKQVFTIHNLAYQGLFNASSVRALGWPESLFTPEKLEFYGQLSFLKAGLVFADAITTVSPTYAREIQGPELGCGLDGLLRGRSADLSGILNGIDDGEWNPKTDRHLPHRFDLDHLAGKAQCKAALQAKLGLPVSARVPLFAMVSRFVEQKGLDILLDVLDDTLFRQAQFAILGNGDKLFEERLLAIDRPQAFAVRVAFDDALAHWLGGGSDFFLVPSRYEPCGLSQMYAMRYGTIPIVRATGGLADTVRDAGQAEGTGFTFEPYTAAALRHAIERALTGYHGKTLGPLQHNGMRADFSWAVPAEHYERLYKKLVK